MDHDDDRGQELVARLRVDGHDVQFTAEEIGARVAARNQDFDAVLLHLRPEAGSIELARYLRTSGRPPNRSRMMVPGACAAGRSSRDARFS
ncbi:MAG TPA: hypothetical protein VMJ10_21815 [Kofleriaceae bacterium]|nr:hypothetical protein [Kofleriaceae bacterium]